MALTSILVHLADDEASGARLDVACGLAQGLGARVTALYAMAPVGMDILHGLKRVPKLVEAYRQGVRDRAKLVEDAFQSHMKQDGFNGEWRCEESDAGPLVTLHARYADLAIVGQRSQETRPEAGYYSGIAEEVVLGAGRPVLVVPYIGSPATVGRRVLVAWNGSREAARALHDALPILEQADRVVVLVINPKAAGRIPGADIAAHLARHGVRAEAAHTPSAGISVGDALLSRVADLGCDLIVMGAYGHSRMREFVMGGATSHILDHMTVPVLMAH